MSLKIYDGLIATANDPFDVARQIREVLEPVFHAKFKEAYDRAKLNQGSLWSDVFLGEGDSKIPDEYRIGHELYKIVEEMHRRPSHTFSDLDFGYDVILYKNSAEGNPLILVFGEQAREYRELLVDQNVATDYGYWDNSDPDEEVSEADWDTRKKAWSEFDEDEAVRSSLMISIPDSVEVAVKLLPPQLFEN